MVAWRSIRPATSATCAASRTRRWRPSTRSTRHMRITMYAAQAAQAAFDLVDRLERELSRFLPNSDITRINHLAAGESTRVAPSTLECLVIARHMFELTGGAFDVSIGTGLALARARPDDSLDPRDDSGVRSISAASEGLRRGSDGGAARGVGARTRARPRRLQLRPRTRAAAGGEGWPLTLSDPGVPSRVLAAPVDAPDGARRVGRAQGRSHRGPAHGEPVRGRLAAWVSLPRPGAAATCAGRAAVRARRAWPMR